MAGMEFLQRHQDVGSSIFSTQFSVLQCLCGPPMAAGTPTITMAIPGRRKMKEPIAKGYMSVETISYEIPFPEVPSSDFC